MTFSIGTVTFEAAPADVCEMIKHADNLMYTVKRGEKDAIAYATFKAGAIISKATGDNE